MPSQMHRGTPGHVIGSSIIGKSGGRGAAGQQPEVGGGPDPAHTALGFQHIGVKPAANGIEVTHIPKSEQGTGEVGHAESPTQEQLHVFRTASEAHHHIGQLLGVRMGSGQQQV